jgi:hypothetical protein
MLQHALYGEDWRESIKNLEQVETLPQATKAFLALVRNTCTIKTAPNHREILHQLSDNLCLAVTSEQVRRAPEPVNLAAIKAHYRGRQSGWAVFLGAFGIKNNVMRATSLRAIIAALRVRAQEHDQQDGHGASASTLGVLTDKNLLQNDLVVQHMLAPGND